MKSTIYARIKVKGVIVYSKYSNFWGLMDSPRWGDKSHFWRVENEMFQNVHIHFAMTARIQQKLITDEWIFIKFCNEEFY
jgi:hypothetical protein